MADLFESDSRKVGDTLETELRKNLKITKKDEETKQNLDTAFTMSGLSDGFNVAFADAYLEMQSVVCFKRAKKRNAFGLQEKTIWAGYSLARAAKYVWLKSPQLETKNKIFASLMRSVKPKNTESKGRWFNECKELGGTYRVEAKIDGYYQPVDLEDIDGDDITVPSTITRAIKGAARLAYIVNDEIALRIKEYFNEETQAFSVEAFKTLKDFVNAKIKIIMEGIVRAKLADVFFGKKRDIKFTPEKPTATIKGKTVEIRKAVTPSWDVPVEQRSADSSIELVAINDRLNKIRRENGMPELELPEIECNVPEKYVGPTFSLTAV